MIIVGFGLVLVLFGVLTVMFHRRGGVSLFVAGLLVTVIGSQPIPTDILAFIALALLVLGLVALRTAVGKVVLLVGAVVGIGWAIGVSGEVPSHPAAAPDAVEDCRDVAFLGLRGSGEAGDAHGGYGAVVGAVRDGVAQALEGSGLTFADMPVAYPALGVTSDDWSLGKDLITGQSLFLAGAATGADTLARRIELIHATCGEATRVVVVSYSQGALAAHLGLARTSTDALSVVAAVALMADPLRAHGQPDAPDGAVAPGQGIAWLVPDRAALGLGGESPSLLPDTWRSWCLTDDLVCAWPGAVEAAMSYSERSEAHGSGYLAVPVRDAVVGAVLGDLAAAAQDP